MVHSERFGRMIRFSTSPSTGMNRVHFIPVVPLEVWKLAGKARASACRLISHIPCQISFILGPSTYPGQQRGWPMPIISMLSKRLYFPLLMSSPQSLSSVSRLLFSGKFSEFQPPISFSRIRRSGWRCPWRMSRHSCRVWSYDAYVVLFGQW